MAVIQSVIFYLLGGTILALLLFTNMEAAWLGVVIIAVIMIAVRYLNTSDDVQEILFKGYASAFMLYIFLFFFFYPFLFKYQSGSETAKLLPVNQDHLRVGSYQSFSPAFEFYSPGVVNLIDSQDQLTNFIQKGPCFVYTSAAIGDSLIRSGVHAKIVGATQYYHITKLKIAFLNHAKRRETLQTRWLLYID